MVHWSRFTSSPKKPEQRDCNDFDFEVSWSNPNTRMDTEMERTANSLNLGQQKLCNGQKYANASARIGLYNRNDERLSLLPFLPSKQTKVPSFVDLPSEICVNVISEYLTVDEIKSYSIVAKDFLRARKHIFRLGIRNCPHNPKILESILESFTSIQYLQFREWDANCHQMTNSFNRSMNFLSELWQRRQCEIHTDVFSSTDMEISFYSDIEFGSIKNRLINKKKKLLQLPKCT